MKFSYIKAEEQFWQLQMFSELIMWSWYKTIFKKNPFLSAALKPLAYKILNRIKIGMRLEWEEKTWNPHMNPEEKRIISSNFFY